MLTFLGAYVDRVPLILRIGLGLTLIFSHGLPKLLEPERWAALGGAMANIGITFAPAFWGFMAGFTEFIGGVLLLIGLAVRPAAAINLFIMFIAAAQNLATAGSLGGGRAHPIDAGVALLALMVLGAGQYYSLDARLGLDRPKPASRPAHAAI